MLALVVLASACSETKVDPPVEPEDDPPTIDLTAPLGGEVIAPGSDLVISWTATDDNGVVGVDVMYSHGGGSGTIAEGVTESSYTWEVPDVDLVSVRVNVVAYDAAEQTDEDDDEYVAE